MDKEGILWVLDKIGVRKYQMQGDNVQISCPLARWRVGHKRVVDRKPSFGILIDQNQESKAHCYSCHFSGTLQSLIEEIHMYSDVDYTKLIEKVASMEELDPEWLADSIGEWEEVHDKYEISFVPEEEIQHMLGKTHRRMLERLEIDTLKAWNSGFDEIQKRTVFPVYTKERRLVGMVGRAVSKFTKPKYLNYFGFDKSRFLYGEHLVRDGSAVVICEGLIDAPATWQALSHAKMLDDYSAVSFLGSQATRFQLKKLINLTDEVILFLDNDPAGWDGQLKAAKHLSNKIRVRAVKYPSHIGGDPAKLLQDGVDVASLIRDAEMIVA